MSNNNDKILNARIGYQQAIAMQSAEVNQTWNRNNVMIIAQSIFVAAIFSIIKDRSIIHVWYLSLIGIFLCLIWFLIIRRGFFYEKYWVMSARELEELYLSPVETLSRGGRLSDGKEVTIKINEYGTFPMKITFNIRTKQLCYILILIFSLVHFIVLIISSWTFIKLCCLKA